MILNVIGKEEMGKLSKFFKRNILWVGFLAVIIPLIIILGLQYESLAELEKTSAVAHKVHLKNYLWDVAMEVEEFYRSNAEEVLDLPYGSLTEEHLDKLGFHFKRRTFQGARRLFVAVFNRHGECRVYFYDPLWHCMESDPESPETHAVNVACAPWMFLSGEGTLIRSVTLTADERDLKNRMLLKPIVDKSSRVIGAAGLILDVPFFRDYYLPSIIRKSLPKYFSEQSRENLIVTVHDGSDCLILATRPLEGQGDAVTMSIPFIFTDWRLGIQSRYMTPEQWAKRYFAINLSLSVLMTLVLVSGIVLALRMASRQMKLSQMKADFVSNVSHELRTPLASIRVFGEFLKLGRVKEPEKVREYGEYIETESRRLTQLINNILDFSKIESGRKTYQFEKAAVEQVVTDTLKMLEIRLKQSGFSVSLAAPQQPLPLTMLDSGAVAQAFMNLLDNAVKYSGPAREVLVRLDQKDGFITLSVTDHGIGIPRGEQDKIFERFYRVCTGLVHDVRGSGLGLSIVKHIVEAHGGKVTVESEPGRGSTFTLHLPVKDDIRTQAEGQQPSPVLARDPQLVTEEERVKGQI
jgi:signal transduction histidine kinase